MPSPEIERQGLLQPEAFDLDDIESSEPQNGHARSQSHDWSKGRKGRAALPNRWLRPRYIICGLATLFILLMLGVAANKGAGIKIPKLIRPSPPTTTATPDEASPTDGPHHPKEPLNPEKSVHEELPDDIVSSITSEAAASLTSALETPPSKTASPTEDSSPSGASSDASVESASPSSAKWEKPADFKIIGLIFFGRPAVVAVLDCYLKKNLVENGGWLDEVLFVVNTDRREDIEWLDTLVETADGYKKKQLKGDLGYNKVWETVEKEHMYIKIDDDIVYFDDNAIPNLVFSKLNHTDSLNVVANLVNSPETGWIHYRVGAIHSYLPELKAPKDPKPEELGPTAWRASKLPQWHEKKMDWPIAGVQAGKEDDGSSLPTDVPGAPPFKGHRWLPLPDDEKNLDKTPMKESSYDPNGPDWGSWSLGAQAHYSFLQNLENDRLDLYHYGSSVDPEREGIWNMMYERMNINFMAIWGKDVLDNLPFETFDDEKALSQDVTQKLRRPLLINTHAIAAHFSFRSQREMYDTDLLDRYRAYANEKVCTKDNQIPYTKITT